MNTKKIALIGAGQIGSRHLQALAKCDFPVSIEVVDPSEASRKMASDRLEQIPRSPSVQSVRFLDSIGGLTPASDLAIVATGSKHRFEVLRALLAQNRPSKLILEKVLFPSIEELNFAEQLLDQSGAQTWVNCPKRAYPAVSSIREKLDPARPFRMEVRGNNWGLACNSIHFIDLAAYFAGQNDYELDTDELDRTIHESKRAGYVEFTGTLRTVFKSGTELLLTSKAEGAPSFQTVLSQGSLEIEINEALHQIRVSRSGGQTSEVAKFSAPPQSELTQRFAREILVDGECALTTFHDSARLHRPFLAGLLAFYSELCGEKQKCIPIT
jgi:predicted dehydrogenase